jgi:hypothetical protein
VCPYWPGLQVGDLHIYARGHYRTITHSVFWCSLALWRGPPCMRLDHAGWPKDTATRWQVNRCVVVSGFEGMAVQEPSPAAGHAGHGSQW